MSAGVPAVSATDDLAAGATAPDSRRGAALGPIARGVSRAIWFAVLAAAGVVLVLAYPMEPIWDQAALLETRFAGPVQPAPDRAFTAQLLVASLAAVTPATANLDGVVRGVALALYVLAAGWLACRLLSRPLSVAAFGLLLMTSQYPFLWLSSELIAGAMLCAVLALAAGGSGGVALGGSLALLALAKPDLALTSVVLLAGFGITGAGEDGLAHARTEQRGAWLLSLVTGLGIALAILLLPGWMAHGAAYFDTYGAGPGGRSFASFSQHYASTIAHFQLADGLPNAWAEPRAYVGRVFPGAETMSDVVIGHPFAYAEFVALACVRGVVKAGFVFHAALLSIPFLWWGTRGLECAPIALRTLWWSFAGLVPFVLLSYPHIRYLARYYPVVLVLMLAALEAIADREPGRRRSLALAGGGGCLLLAAVENVRRASTNWALLPELDRYWFPD
jgi:hypothetical protein